MNKQVFGAFSIFLENKITSLLKNMYMRYWLGNSRFEKFISTLLDSKFQGSIFQDSALWVDFSALCLFSLLFSIIMLTIKWECR